MYYFIPSWYSEQRPWTEKELPWYQMHTVLEFDDSISQIQMFKQAHEDIKILLFSYAPNLRHFLHRQDIFSVPYWSVFDDIQNIQLKKVRQLGWKNFAWPEDIEWIYTPLAMIGRRNGSLYTRLDFGQEGHLLSIQLFKENNKVKNLIFDDRGFLSSILRWEGEKPITQTYYDDHGNWRIEEDFTTREVKVNPIFKADFNKAVYPSIKALMAETFDAIKRDIAKKDVVVLAADTRHNDCIVSKERPFKRIVSFFGNRGDVKAETFKDTISNASLLVCDSEDKAEHLERVLGQSDPPVYALFPFDARCMPGTQRRGKTLKIYFAIGEAKIDAFRSSLNDIFHLMARDMSVQLVVGASISNTMSKPQMIAYLQDLADRREDARLCVDDENKTMFDPLVNDEEEDPDAARIFVHTYASENDWICFLNDISIIVDVKTNPEIFLQIAGMSIGIPQISNRNTRYVKHLKNGYILNDISQLTEALQYYLADAAHRNEAAADSLRTMEKNSGTRLVKRWKEAMDNND